MIDIFTSGADPFFELELKHRITILHRTRVKGDIGGERWEYTEAYTSVPCMIQGKPIRQAELGKYTMWAKIDTDISEGDHVEITYHTFPNLVGEVFEVTFIDDAGGQGHHIECDLDELSGSE